MRANGEQLEDLRTAVALGEYQVDSHQIAAAMLDRIDARAVDRKIVSARAGGRALQRALTDLQAA